MGVLGVRGEFRAGDAVRLLDATGAELGRGLAKQGATDAVRLAGHTSNEEDNVLIHRDELVVWPASDG